MTDEHLKPRTFRNLRALINGEASEEQRDERARILYPFKPPMDEPIKLSRPLRVLNWLSRGAVLRFFHSEELNKRLMRLRIEMMRYKNEAGGHAIRLLSENDAQAALIRELKERIEDPKKYDELMFAKDSQIRELKNKLEKSEKEKATAIRSLRDVSNDWNDYMQKYGVKKDDKPGANKTP